MTEPTCDDCIFYVKKNRTRGWCDFLGLPTTQRTDRCFFWHIDMRTAENREADRNRGTQVPVMGGDAK